MKQIKKLRKMKNKNESSGSGFFDTSNESIHDFRGSLIIQKSVNNSQIRPFFDPKNQKEFGLPINLESSFSITNDLKMGWKPKVGMKNPFPLYYHDELTKLLDSKKFIYRGFRPSHSYKLHSAFSGSQGYQFRNKSF